MDLIKNIISGKQLLDRLKSEDWEKIIPKLHYYSLNKLERFSFLHGLYDINNLATQIADDAIRLVWEEQRKWNTNYYKDLYSLLKGVVDSLISNFIESKEVEITESLNDETSNFDFNAGSNPESDYIAKEIEHEIMVLLQNDNEAFLVFECLKDGLKPREISAELEWEINQVYNTLKRVQRKLKEYSQLN